MKPISELLNILELARLDEQVFEGDSKDIGSRAVFGGQVLAQALNAATRSLGPERLVHSLHGYFILAGNMSKPIRYEVDLLRDGRSFTTRRVIAKQDDRAIFVMAASFQVEEEGFEHQIEMLNVPPPESLMSLSQLAEQLPDNFPLKRRGLFAKDSPIDVRPVENIHPFKPGRRPPFRHVWFRANGDYPDEQAIHRTLLAYASDFNLLMAALLPHNISLFSPGLQIASLDHALWFHRAFKANEWMLYAIDSPSASGARGFCRGSIFSHEGALIASVAQEGLIRMRG
jgi:acyl-CoA thioesterase II